jgi:hypothetical protein
VRDAGGRALVVVESLDCAVALWRSLIDTCQPFEERASSKGGGLPHAFH